MIARRSILPMANVVLGAFLGLLALKVVAEYFSASTYGAFEAAYAYLGILYIFADLSMDQAHVKRVSEGMDAADCFVTYAVFRAVAAIVFVVVAVGALFTYTVVLGRTIEDTTTYALVFCMIYFVLKGAQSVAQSTFDARLESARAQLGSLVETVVRVGLTIFFAILFHSTIPFVGKITAEGAVADWVRANPAGALALTYAAGSFIAAVVMIAYLGRAVKKGHFRMPILKSYFAFALPLFIPTAASLIAFFIDRAMLAFFGTSVDTAEFTAPRRLVGVLEAFSAALGVVLFPAISGMIASGQRAAVPAIVDRSRRYLVIVTLPLIALLAAFPLSFIRLALSDQYEGAALTLSLLAIWAFFLVASRPFHHFLLGHGHVRAVARVGIISSLVVVGLNLILIPDNINALGITLFGLKAVGAAISTVIAAIVTYWMTARYARKLEGYTPSVSLWRPIAAAGIMVGALMLLDNFTSFHPERWFSLVAYSALGTAIYGVALVGLQELTRADLAFAQETLNPREMWRYIRSEIFSRSDSGDNP